MTIDIDRILAETFVAQAEYHASIASTSDRAAQCIAGDGERLPLLVVADRQTAGRGRGGNRWWTGDGALAFSLLLPGSSVDHSVARPEVRRAWSADAPRPSLRSGTCHPVCGRAPLLALATAVAVIDTVAPLLPRHQVGLHWPNDVFVAGRKLAGILIEVLADGRQVIGIGLNSNNSLADAPVELKATAATLRDLRREPCDQTALLIDLLQRLQHELARSAAETEAVAARADALCLQRGRQLTIRWDARSITGRCRGIAPDGALLLQTPAGTEAFYSGVVSGSNAP